MSDCVMPYEKIPAASSEINAMKVGIDIVILFSDGFNPIA
jgi:hypothetical protein